MSVASEEQTKSQRQSAARFSGPDGDPYAATDHMSPDMVFLQMVCESRLAPTSTVIDVGANIGRTVELFSRYTDGRILALEPSPMAFPYLVQNIQAMNLENVVPVQLAATSGASTVGFFDNPTSASASHLVIPGTLHKTAQIEVAGAPLSTIAKAHNAERPSFIKIDVEGFELDVLDGAQELLERSRPDVFIEFNMYTMIDFRNINPRDLLAFVRSRFPHVHWFDDDRIVRIDNDNAASTFLHDTIVFYQGVRDIWCSFST